MERKIKMLRYDSLYKLMIAATVAGVFFSPMKASAQEVQIFPPQLPGTTTICPALDPSAGYQYTLVWDGQNNVQCSKVPTSCPMGEGLQYDPSSGNFMCIEPCSGPSQGFIAANPPCPAGQQGGTPVQVTCDGQVIPGTPIACQPVTPISTVVTSPVTVGTVMSGQLLPNGTLDQNVCITNPAACSNYVVTTSGLAPQ
jgi:hypothetical protein